MADKTFVDGLFAKEANEKVKHFIPARLSFKASEFIPFLNAHTVNEYMNVDIKISKNGKMYAELDTWQPEKRVDEIKKQISNITSKGHNGEEIDPESVPF